jgi:hypothetical protein
VSLPARLGEPAEGATVHGGSLEKGLEMITKPFSLEALAGRGRAVLSPG